MRSILRCVRVHDSLHVVWEWRMQLDVHDLVPCRHFCLFSWNTIGFAAMAHACHSLCLPQVQGPELCCAVLDTLTALVAGSPANRRALGWVCTPFVFAALAAGLARQCMLMRHGF